VRAALLVAVLGWTLLPTAFPLTVCGPLLALACYRWKQTSALWLGALHGLLLDLFSADLPMGFHTLATVVTVSFVCRGKQFFFEDSLFTVPLLAGAFSCIRTIVEVLLRVPFGSSLALSGQWIAGDVVLLPLADALFAAIFYVLPTTYLAGARRMGDPLPQRPQ
jgi:cell shape-determining protein MreD